MEQKVIEIDFELDNWRLVDCSWDEWVPENRVLKYNDANLEKQRELVAATEAQKTKKKKANDDLVSTPGSGRSSPAPATSGAKTTRAAATAGGDTTSKKKIKVEPSVETEVQYTKKCEVKIKIPDEIKSWLVDDWDFITRQKKLVRLPAQVNVDQILDSYIEAKKGTKLSEEQVVEVMSGIREYFNVMIGCQLLYKFERPQYNKLAKENAAEDGSMSSCYGVIHLLRLFTKLGQVLVYTDLDEKDMPQLIFHLQEFLK